MIKAHGYHSFVYLMAFSVMAQAAPLPVETLFQRLAGHPLLKKDPRYKEMEALLQQGKSIDAAHIATSDAGFINTTVRDLAAALSNRKETPVVELNDFTALFMGTVRDDLDSRQLLNGNFRYEGKPTLGISSATVASNSHYTELEKQAVDLKENLIKVEPQWPGWQSGAGLLTTRTWASEHLIAGTNRRTTEYAFREFMCAPLEKWRLPGISDHRVRHDVNRRPGDDPSRYHSECRTCHAMIDGMSGAWANMDFREGKLVTSKGWVAPKMNQNSEVSPQEGYQTFDNSWENLAVTPLHTSLFGWHGTTEGVGIHEFGTMLANSDRFSSCLTERVFQKVCRRIATATEVQTLQKLASEFKTDGYQLRKLFEKVSLLEFCNEG